MRLSQSGHLDEVAGRHLGHAHLSDVFPDAPATFTEQVRTDQLLCVQSPFKVLQSQNNQPAQVIMGVTGLSDSREDSGASQ